MSIGFDALLVTVVKPNNKESVSTYRTCVFNNQMEIFTLQGRIQEAKELLITGVGYNPDRHEVYASLGEYMMEILCFVWEDQKSSVLHFSYSIDKLHSCSVSVMWYSYVDNWVNTTHMHGMLLFYN